MSTQATVPNAQASQAQVHIFDQVGRNLIREAQEGGIKPVFGRDDEIDRMVSVLARATKPNILITAPPGAGKTALIEGLALRIAHGEAGPLNDAIIVQIDLASMAADTGNRGQFERRMKSLIEAATSDPRYILFVDEAHLMMTLGAREEGMNFAQIMKPELARGKLRMICATTEDEAKILERDKAMTRRFIRLRMEEPSIKQAIGIVGRARIQFERHHGVVVSNAACCQSVMLAKRFMGDRALPDSAFDLLDDACVIAARGKVMDDKIIRQIRRDHNLDRQEAMTNFFMGKSNTYDVPDDERLRPKVHKKIVHMDHVSHACSIRANVPVQATQSDLDRVDGIADRIRSRLIGQDQAVEEICDLVTAAVVDLRNENRPLGVMLLAGPTGVGKTMVCKLLAKELFGTADALVTIDMSEYGDRHTVARLIGAPPGYTGHESGGILIDKMLRRPSCVLLFDEIEKAHPDVMNIFLQMFEEGRITDGQGRVASLRNCIIVMTSNCGAREAQEARKAASSGIGFMSFNQDKVLDAERKAYEEALSEFFRPEILNRMDRQIFFRSLGIEEMRQVTRLEIKDIVTRVAAKGFELVISDAVCDHIAESGSDPKYGARGIRRAVEMLVQIPVAKAIASRKMHHGLPIEIRLENGDVVVGQWDATEGAA
jgi:ATP-dependent Clp protease ATP-binding subunit ClpA